MTQPKIKRRQLTLIGVIGFTRFGFRVTVVRVGHFLTFPAFLLLQTKNQFDWWLARFLFLSHELLQFLLVQFLLVLLSLDRLDKPLQAKSTLQRLLSGVDAGVALQILRSGERFAAVRADVGSLTGVDALV